MRGQHIILSFSLIFCLLETHVSLISSSILPSQLSYLKFPSFISSSALFSHSSKKKYGKLTIDQIKSLIEDNKTDLYQIQELLERDCYKATSQKLHFDNENISHHDENLDTDIYQSLTRRWFVQITQTIMKSSTFSFPLVHNLSKSAQTQYRNILQSIDPDRIALVCLQEMTRVSAFDSENHRAPALKLAVSIGNSLLRELLIEKAANISRESPNDISPRYLSELIRKSEIMSNYTTRRQYSEFVRDINRLQNTFQKKLRRIESTWSYKTNIEIGMYLIYQALHTFTFPKSLVRNTTSNSAFVHKIVSSGVNRRGYIEMDPAIYELLVNQSRPLVLEPWSLPMLVSPKPWLTYNYGGYLLHSTNCVRLKVRYLYSFFSCRLGQAGDIHLDRLQTQDEKGTLHRILSGLDVLGQTAWKVNNNILSVVEKVQELNDKDSLLTAKDSITTSLTESVFDDFPEMHSSLEIKWEQHFKIEVAKLFSNLTFYLPHSLDFRGRAYPIAPYLSVVGDDLSRGLLLYGQGKKLGTQGWYWLRVHLANTAGYSKGKTYAERVQYTDKHLEDILDSANHPLTGRQWWKNCGTSTPWQCLAACFEIRDALLEENPVDYISHLPISQDGSCNGFQHYAALGKDTEGAYAVNLIPSRDTNRTILREHQRPQDIYLHVARCVSTAVADEAARYRQQRLEDASTLQDSSNSDSSHISEILCQKISSRSLYKRIVMTSVYGVTPYTARIHLTEYLLQENIVPPNRIIEASLYLVNKIFEALYSSLFQRAKYIQDWLTTVATEIGRSVPPNSPLLNPYSSEAITYPQTFLSWTTPLGFQVTQPYILPLPSEQHKTAHAFS